ncbi:hypothetical protein MM300_04220 [Evansella sp. LMS18]|uniref:hypothetical protein n=1 Tax=Evansella sp. LMS18 TaxID=2924033 RepID=UPI0020D05A1F|nr:hypothetical protein [Evansella sp. LMS18]UTR11543.1 hypothetical protein MM300_04220 [Evansella sp. LMS18]
MSGFILHSLFSYVTSHVNFSIMSSLFLILAIVYFARDLINFPFPVIQWKWQIPPSWVSFSQPGNMAVWGLILGAGVFTYNPFPLFLLMYLYAGIFLSPVSGILIGLTFGLARSLASVAAASALVNPGKESFQKLWNSSWYRVLHLSGTGALILLAISKM